MNRHDDTPGRDAAFSGVWRAMIAMGARGVATLGRTLARRKEAFDLSRLDDRDLSDMGLTRSDLAEASRWSLWGEPTGRLAELGEGRRRSRLG